MGKMRWTVGNGLGVINFLIPIIELFYLTESLGGLEQENYPLEEQL